MTYFVAIRRFTDHAANGRMRMHGAVETSAMRKIYLRLLPFAVLSYILAYIDRINVSFAGLTMRGDLKLSATDFGFALGTFFLGYFLFEVPSNVIMEKVGARIWIARIMVTWGICAAIMAFVYDTTSFSIVRFLLGVAEAGFFPGMLLYFTYWFPRKHHARIVSGFLVGLPISVALGAPISTALLSLDGLFGLKGWQVLYIAEAVPTIVVGLLTLLVLTDRPEQANFLSASEKSWITAKIASERLPREDRKFGLVRVLILSLMYLIITVASLALLSYTPEITAWLKAYFGDVPPVVVVLIPYIFGTMGLMVWGRIADHNLWKAMINAKVLLLGVNYFGIVTASLGMLYFIPQIIKSLADFSNMQVGWLTMIPYICGGIGMLIWGRVSDAMNERRWNLLVACVLSTGGLVLAGYTMGTWWALVGMSLAAIGFYGSKGPFFAMPPMFLSGTALAGAGFAWINSIGNLGGTVGPYYVGYMKDLTGNFAGGLYGLALLSLVAALVCAFFLHIPQPSEVEAPQLDDARPA
jgi:ACS family tartrate transporter-like MFS transporter